MPIIKEFPKGSIIYFEGDKSDKIYALQSGKIVLIHKSLDEHTEEKNELQVGEFFGVKSTLGRYPREETAQVVGGARVIIFTPEEFQNIVIKNTRLVLQMSKVFSKQLREIHSKVREVLKVDSIKDPEYEIINVGESFYIAGYIEHAEYVFEKYLDLYPYGKFKERAEMLLQRARKGDIYPPDILSLENYLAKIINQMSELNFVKEGFKSVEDEFFQIPSLKEDSSHLTSNLFFPEEELKKVLNLVQENKYKEAYDLLVEIEKNEQVKTEPKIMEQVLFEKGRILSLLKNYKGSIEVLIQYLREYPTGIFLKQALFQLGVIFEILKDYKKSEDFYKKVLVIKPEDDITMQAKTRLVKLPKG